MLFAVIAIWSSYFVAVCTCVRAWLHRRQPADPPPQNKNKEGHTYFHRSRRTESHMYFLLREPHPTRAKTSDKLSTRTTTPHYSRIWTPGAAKPDFDGAVYHPWKALWIRTTLCEKCAQRVSVGHNMLGCAFCPQVAHRSCQIRDVVVGLWRGFYAAYCIDASPWTGQCSHRLSRVGRAPTSFS